MNSNKLTLRIVGILFLLATAASVAGFILIQSGIKGTDYLASLYPGRFRFSLGVFFHLVCDMAILGIGVFMFRIIRKNSENVAVGYLSTRIFEALIQIIGCIGLLLLITISKQYIQEGTDNDTYYQTLGTLARKWNSWSFEVSFIATGLGGIILCYWLLKSKLIPWLISIIGLLGYIILFAKSLSGILGYRISMIFFIPVALFELIFPIWIIIKGFNTLPIITDTKTNKYNEFSQKVE